MQLFLWKKLSQVLCCSVFLPFFLSFSLSERLSIHVHVHVQCTCTCVCVSHSIFSEAEDGAMKSALHCSKAEPPISPCTSLGCSVILTETSTINMYIVHVHVQYKGKPRNREHTVYMYIYIRYNNFASSLLMSTRSLL